MANPKDILEKFNNMVSHMNEEKMKEKNRLEMERRDMIMGMGKEMANMTKPLMEMLANQARINKEDLKEAIKQIQIKPPEVNVNTPDVYVPDIKVPTPQVSVNIPPIKVPDIQMPHEMDIKGWVKLQGVDLSNPLPVQIRDKDGKPVNFFENLTTVIAQGGGSGKHDFFTIKGFGASAYADYLNGDNRLRVSVETGGAGLTDAELRASAVPVNQVSGANWSMNVASQDFTFDVKQVSGSINSTNVMQLAGNTIATNNGDTDAGTQRIVIARSANATTAAVSVGADTSTSIVPTQAGRKSIVLVHTSTSNLYVSTGSAASSSAFPLVANQIYGFDDYTGPVNAIAEEQAGTISVKYIEIV